MADGWMVISAGVNVNSNPAVADAVSLREICGSGDISAGEVRRHISERLDERLEELNISGFGDIRDYWLRYVNGMNSIITLRNGSDSIAGVFEGIDSAGRLILAAGGERMFISAGDMFLNTKGITVNRE
jgi:biotin-(acetyl-CoA carboxylase) ligase